MDSSIMNGVGRGLTIIALILAVGGVLIGFGLAKACEFTSTHTARLVIEPKP